jgi:hypothetical protein
MVNLEFKKADKMLPKSVIRKMRQEDLRKFLVENKKFMSPVEQKKYKKEIFGQGTYPCGNELLVERVGNKIKFRRFE